MRPVRSDLLSTPIYLYLSCSLSSAAASCAMQSSIQVLTDVDVSAWWSQTYRAIQVIERALSLHGQGRLIAPPRVSADKLTFTAGGDENIIGFRVYPMMKGAAESDQLVAVWDRHTGTINGIVVSNMLGPLRTACIGAVAADYMARPECTVLGIIGSGVQAKAHVMAVQHVRQLRHVLIYSRSVDKRERLATELRKIGIAAQAVSTARDACTCSDMVTLATDSKTPVIESSWIQPNTHVTTIGPKSALSMEIPADLVDRAALIATDSLAQLHNYSAGHVFAGRQLNIVELGKLVADGNRRGGKDGISLFLSVGLAGTETLLANEMLDSS